MPLPVLFRWAVSVTVLVLVRDAVLGVPGWRTLEPAYRGVFLAELPEDSSISVIEDTTTGTIEIHRVLVIDGEGTRSSLVPNIWLARQNSARRTVAMPTTGPARPLRIGS